MNIMKFFSLYLNFFIFFKKYLGVFTFKFEPFSQPYKWDVRGNRELGVTNPLHPQLQTMTHDCNLQINILMVTIEFEPGFDELNATALSLTPQLPDENYAKFFSLYLTFYFLWILHGQLLERDVPFLVGPMIKQI